MFILFPILCFIVFQPFLNDVVSKRGDILEITAKKATQLAAEDGYLSPRVIATIKQDLGDLYWDSNKLTITGTSNVQMRGNDVTVEVKYPVGSLYIFTNFFGSDSDPKFYHYKFTEYSEYM
ncbi:hypothetical protein [Bacillus sp. FJAT-27264]|uniref:hypothetical protein n=1 Tax=Paenibacillus sp. (strain DSM 101736 / FJAT-27264) TaxID=1850362 RepID=UPI0011123670|nr:hypothetical protein [Bacillus sp. FJAT-27264]